MRGRIGRRERLVVRVVVLTGPGNVTTAVDFTLISAVIEAVAGGSGWDF